MRRRATGLFVFALGALFAFRLAFGLTHEFFFEDETQIFLIGLRQYATGTWPWFGPDVVWTRSEIPGALQGWLVSLPLHIVPAPEAPFVLLNLLSFGALVAYARYITLRVPSLPRWLVYGWLLTIPWTLQFSTHVVNPSYVLPAALVFFIGFFEVATPFASGRVPPPLAMALMGAATTWVMQVHMSWPLLLPFAGLAWLSRWREGAARLAGYAAAGLAGALLPALLIVPTVIEYGLQGGSGGTLRNMHLHGTTPAQVLSTVARFLSFSSLEIVRFMGTDNAKRLMLLDDHRWLVPFAAVAWVAGLVQPLWMLREWFRPRASVADWPALRVLVVLTLALIVTSYLLVMEPPQAHAFYVVAPVSFMFAAYCWTFVDSPVARRAAAVVLAINIAFHVGLAVVQMPRRSLYRDREPIAAAIALKQPEMFAHRRPFAIAAGPLALQDPTRPYNPPRDLHIDAPVLSTDRHHVALWHFTLRNTNPHVAFRDVLYLATYRDAAGRVLAERHGFVKNIFQPGEARPLDVNDGFAVPGAVSSSITVIGAEALLPVRAAGEGGAGSR